MIRACPHIHAMRIDFEGGNKTKTPPFGGWGGCGKSTFLVRVKIFYFYPFLEIASCAFVLTKADFATFVGATIACNCPGANSLK